MCRWFPSWRYFIQDETNDLVRVCTNCGRTQRYYEEETKVHGIISFWTNAPNLPWSTLETIKESKK